MSVIFPGDLVCPKCGRKPDVNYAVTVRKYSVRALSLPWFSCRNCWVCGFSKLLIRQIVGSYRNDLKRSTRRKYPYKEIHQEAVSYLLKIAAYEFNTRKIRFANFRRKSAKKT